MQGGSVLLLLAEAAFLYRCERGIQVMQLYVSVQSTDTEYGYVSISVSVTLSVTLSVSVH